MRFFYLVEDLDLELLGAAAIEVLSQNDSVIALESSHWLLSPADPVSYEVGRLPPVPYMRVRCVPFDSFFRCLCSYREGTPFLRGRSDPETMVG